MKSENPIDSERFALSDLSQIFRVSGSKYVAPHRVIYVLFASVAGDNFFIWSAHSKIIDNQRWH